MGTADDHINHGVQWQDGPARDPNYPGGGGSAVEPEGAYEEKPPESDPNAFINKNNKTFGFIKQDNCLRKCAGTLARHPRFEAFILGAIILNSLQMALRGLVSTRTASNALF